MMKKLCLSALSLLLSFAAIADSVEVDGIFYYLDAGTKTAEVTNNPFGYKGSVNIPASVTYSGTDYVVTSIGSRAFHSSSDLTSVTIGDGVTAIGYDAFSYCRSLASVTLGNYSAFSNTDCATLHVPAQSIEAYKVADPWKNFKDIVHLDGESIETPQYTLPDNRISIYTADGKLIGSTTSKERAETIINNLKRGSLAIIRVGEKSEKRVIP